MQGGAGRAACAIPAAARGSAPQHAGKLVSGAEIRYHVLFGNDRTPKGRQHVFQPSRLNRLVPVALEITGRRRNLALALWQRLYPLPGDGLLRIAGQNITVDPRHPSERLLFYFFSNVMRSYRCSGLGRLIETTLGAGDVFFDIGANLGMYSWLARRRGATAICFEPEPAHAAFLRRNAVVCDRLLPIALSDQAGEAVFYVCSDENPGGNSLVMSTRGWEKSGYAREMRVRTERLDALAQSEAFGAIERLKLIKIDVEGAEAQVVRGMTGLLEAGAAPAIWCEVRGEESDRNPGSYRSVIEVLKAFGYSAFVWRGSRFEPYRPSDVTQVFDLLLRRV